MTKYGYFAIERTHGGILKLPDGETKIFDGRADANKAWTKWIEENVLPEAKREAERKRQEFVAGCTEKERRIKQSGMLSPDLVTKAVYGPAEELLDEIGHQTFDEIVEASAFGRFPEPTISQLKEATSGGPDKCVVWAAGLFLDGSYEPLPSIPNWSFGMPIEAVLGILNDLAAKGWTVADVSEDRGIYAGVTNQTSSAINRARYLLVHA